MTRILLLSAIAIGLLGAAATADAQSRSRQAPPSVLPPPGYVPPAQRPRGPPWAMPNECYIDEGFGRFSPCR